eukprot:CAMPEP_0197825568 /NCGR_PEP_ID=MMETSP1437-20131217/2613_1 /TAXON_ID=49252 ORGANISM="Eucampia antarctica, Strain CCMP1452" /NCGR_SAMPLE_ID=MMETSP1437 /ASSEMBLY_ACC=CAM_ASM_001096 /LENGTH=213 /DNA_ID=CAMNT_0043425599 /DNA_START=86 /DNA_END=724 /DNA_ORIENTATION=-
MKNRSTLVVVGKIVFGILLFSKYTVDGFVLPSSSTGNFFSKQQKCDISLLRLSEQERFGSPPSIRIAEKSKIVKNLEEDTVLEKDERESIANKEDDKFSFGQKIESIKTGVVGLLSGGIAAAPVIALHDLVFADQTIINQSAQWEFDTDMGSIEAALFAIVYRYCVRDDDNEMLEMGCIGAFVVVRTLSRVRLPTYCLSAPLSCGEPLGYFDW